MKTDSYAYIRVCSDHFLSRKPCTFYDTTNPGGIPPLNLDHSDISQSDTSRHDGASVWVAKWRKVQEQVVDNERGREVTHGQQESLQVEAVAEY